jgi:hypothetical protein
VERDQVRVREVDERAELSLEAEQIAAVGAPQDLERDVAPTDPVEDTVDDPRPPFAQRGANLVPIVDYSGQGSFASNAMAPAIRKPSP